MYILRGCDTIQSLERERNWTLLNIGPSFATQTRWTDLRTPLMKYLEAGQTSLSPSGGIRFENFIVLQSAAITGQDVIAELLLRHRVKVETSSFGRAALYIAAELDHASTL